MELKLPIKSEKAKNKNPKKIFLFSHTKVGKTLAASLLPENLILDLEGGAGFCDGMIIDVRKFASDNNITVLQALKQIADSLRSSEHKYKYLTLDTATSLESYAEQLAVILYKKSPIGKNYTGTNVVSDLANGAGYAWLRTAFEEIYNLFDSIPTEALIILGHTKLSSINKEGKELQVKDLNLTGINLPIAI